MNDPQHNPEQLFYEQVSQLLGCELIYQPWPFSKKTRWNNRQPGNGRFVGHGIIRRYSSELIHVHLHNPRLVSCFTSEQQVFDAITTALLQGTNA